jgi:hypothetical protein
LLFLEGVTLLPVLVANLTKVATCHTGEPVATIHRGTVVCPALQMILKTLVWEGQQVGLELAHNSTTPNYFLPLTLGDRPASILNLSHPELMLVFSLVHCLGRLLLKIFSRGNQENRAVRVPWPGKMTQGDATTRDALLLTCIALVCPTEQQDSHLTQLVIPEIVSWQWVHNGKAIFMQTYWCWQSVRGHLSCQGTPAAELMWVNICVSVLNKGGNSDPGMWSAVGCTVL